MSTCTRCVKKVYARGMCDVHYGQWRRRQQAYGRTTSMYVDAGPVREHIEALSAAGVSYKRLHKLSGVALSSIARIVTGRTERGEGPAKQVHRGVADRILAVPLPGTHAFGHEGHCCWLDPNPDVYEPGQPLPCGHCIHHEATAPSADRK